MKNLFAKLSGMFLGAVFVLGQFTANSACMAEYYQPEVPAGLKKQN